MVREALLPGGSQSTASLVCEPRSLNLVEQMATRRLATNGSYVHAFRNVRIRFEDGVLMLTGRIPTFYLKQVLQTLLTNLDGVMQIDNRVEVIPARPHHCSAPK